MPVSGFPPRVVFVASAIFLFACTLTQSILASRDPTAAQTSPATAIRTRTALAETAFDVKHTLTLVNRAGGAIKRFRMTVALVSDVEPYQTVLRSSMDPSDWSDATDEYGNRYAIFEWKDVEPGEERQAVIETRVLVRAYQALLGRCEGGMISDFLAPEKYIESDSADIIELAGSLKRPQDTPCDTARVLYDYVADTLEYSGYEPGEVGAENALQAGRGDCTEFSDLLVALSRASGIPARSLEGVSCCTVDGYAEGNIKHDWLELYLPGTGWAPMDPTYGKHPGSRDAYFASMPANRVIVTRGRTLEMLNGWHYYRYSFWFEGDRPDPVVREEWSILQAE